MLTSVALFSGLPAAALWLSVLLEVVGQSPCPTPAAVTAELRRLKPGQGPGGGAAARVELRRSRRGELVLLLKGRAGARLAERRLPRGDDCAALARAAAVVVSLWERELEAGTRRPPPPAPTPRPTPLPPPPPPPPAPSPPPPAPPPVAPRPPEEIPSVIRVDPPRPPPAPAPAAAPPSAPIAAPAPVAPPPSAPAAAAPPAPAGAPAPVPAEAPAPAGAVALAVPAPTAGGVGLEVAASGLALVSSDGAAGAGLISLGVGRRLTGPAGHLFFGGSGRRTATLPGGAASYTRLVTGLEGSWRFAPGRAWSLDSAVQGLLGALLADGVGLPGARGGSAFDPGLGAQLRLGRRLGPTQLQLTVGLWAWPRAQTLVVLGQGATREVPRIEGLFGLGLAFGNR